MLEPTRWDVVPSQHPWWDALPFSAPMLDTAGLISLSEGWQHGSDRRRWLHPQITVLAASAADTTLAVVEAKITERLHV